MVYKNGLVMILLVKEASEIVLKLRKGEVPYAMSLYHSWLNNLFSEINSDHVESFLPLFEEMLKAQEARNYVWLADLIEYILIDSIKSIYKI